MIYALTFGFYTKTISALKKEAAIRRHKRYNASRVQLISAMLGLGLAAAHTATFV